MSRRVNDSKVGRTIKSFDMFGQSPGFFVNGSATNGTFLGAFISFGVIFLALSYGIRQA